jgi:hypothetical protein
VTVFEYGPIEFYAIAFDGDRPGPAVLEAIDDIVAAGVVNVLDLVFAARDASGELSLVELSDTIDDGIGSTLGLGGIAGVEDVELLTEQLPPGTSAAILVVELVWAKAFAAALYDAGGAVIAREGVPAPIVNAFLAEHA